jgi:hypothetical protein
VFQKEIAIKPLLNDRYPFLGDDSSLASLLGEPPGVFCIGRIN